MNEEKTTMGEVTNGDVNSEQNTNTRNSEVPEDSDQPTRNASNMDMVAEGSLVVNKQNMDDDDNKKLFVGGLAHDITDDQIRTYFSHYGEVSNVNIKSDLMTKKPRGFAFVSFTTCEAVIDTLKVTSHSINGKQIDPKRAKARPKPAPMKKIFVGGLSPDIAEQEIISYFEQYGKVENVELPYDKVQNKRRAFCFVCFENEKSALDAAAKSKQVVPPMTKQCDVKIATPPKPDPYGYQPMPFGRGRDRYGSSAFGGYCYGGGYGQNFAGYNGNYGGYNGSFGNNYDYSAGSGYNGGYSGGGNNYDSGYWNYNQNNYGGGYGDSQCSDDYTRDTM